jgi:transcriptional regulator with XRE-family HTH domain
MTKDAFLNLNANILSLDEKSPSEVTQGISQRVRARRLELDLTQKALSGRAGMPLATYRRFETTGEISLKNLVMIATALGMTEDFEALFSSRRYRSIEEIQNIEKVKARKRGQRNE